MSTTASTFQLRLTPRLRRADRGLGRSFLACVIGAQLVCTWHADKSIAMSIRRAPFHGGTLLPFAWEHPVWRTLAGFPNAYGTNDGPGISARFGYPSGIAVDATGTIYVADSENRVIRRISPAGIVSTVAGKPGQSGSKDGPAAETLFSYPAALALDASGNLYIADNCAVRKLSTAGEVTTIAGQPGVTGYRDGSGTNALFQRISGLALDTHGSVYAADSDNHVVRKISIAGQVSTVAGQAGVHGYKDGVGTNALFGSSMGGLVLDSNGDLFVAESGWVDGLGPCHIIRKISPAGLVSTWVGQLGRSGYRDGHGTNAWFGGPKGLTIDKEGNLYVTETENRCLRKVSPDGRVSTLGGDPFISGHRDGIGPFATFISPQGVAVEPSGRLLVVDSSDNTVRYGSVVAESQPRFVAQPRSQTVQEGTNVTFSVVAQSNTPLTYQWLFSGQPIPNATNTTVIVEHVSPEVAGEYSVAVSDGVGYVVSFAATLRITSSMAISGSPLDNWHPLASLQLLDIHGLAHGQDRYVAVGDAVTGAIATSTDGEHWVKQLPVSSEIFKSVAFGNGRFVIVGYNGAVFTSATGLAWEAQTLTSEGRPNLHGIVFDQGVFVAVSGDANGSIWTSPDGSNWTNRGVDFGVSFLAVWAGEGKFIAVGNTIMISTNGVDWMPAIVPAGTNYLGQEILIEHIACANGTFLSGQHFGGLLAASATGQEWQDVTPTNGLQLGGVVCGNGQFVAVDANSGGTCVSTDGWGWAAPAIITSGGRAWSSLHICFENGQFVASGDYGRLATSPDGNSWTCHQQQQAIPITPAEIINVAGRYFAAGGDSAIATSTNGSDWEPLFTPTVAGSLVYGDGTLVTVGPMDQIGSSQDGGLTWTDRSPHLNYVEKNPYLNQIAYGEGVFVAVGHLNGYVPAVGRYLSQGRILSSSNLVNWVATDFPLTNSISDVTFGGGVFVALLNIESGGTQILTSTNGFSWKTATTLPTDYLYYAAYGNGRFVLAGSEGDVIGSPDGTTWSRHPVPGANYINKMVFGNGLFLAMANDRLWSSPDGLTWTQWAAPGSNLQALAAGEGVFLIFDSGFDYNRPILYQGGPIERLGDPRWLSNTSLEWTVTGAPRINYRIEFSEDLLNWQMLTHVTNAPASAPFIDPEAATRPSRFYRVVTE